MLEVRAGTGADRRTATQLVPQAAGGCPNQRQGANRGIGDRNGKRDCRPLAMSEDPRSREVQLASRAHGAQRVACVVDTREQVARRPITFRLPASARVVPE